MRVLLPILLSVFGLAGQVPQAGEAAVKAAFLYNFTKFIGWPSTAFANEGAPFTVCIFAGDDFRREVEAMMGGEQVQGRRVAVAAVQNGDDLKGCHLAYFSREHGDRAVRRLTGVRETPVLTVGEGRRFLDQGGLIAFSFENDRVRFDISKRAADRAGLNISAKLLRVARSVEGGEASP